MSYEVSKLSANSFLSFQIIFNLSELWSVSKVFKIPYIKLTEFPNAAFFDWSWESQIFIFVSI